MEMGAGDAQGEELPGKCRQTNGEQRSLCLKPGTWRKMKEVEQVL